MSLMVRTPLLIESHYHAKKRKAFKGSRRIPGRGAWLPKSIRPQHQDGNRRVNPDGPQRSRAGDPLRLEPQRYRAARMVRPLAADLLVRSALLLDHDQTEIALAK